MPLSETSAQPTLVTATTATSAPLAVPPATRSDLTGEPYQEEIEKGDDMSTETSGAWEPPQVAQFLTDATIPVRLACVGSDGFPRVVSLWYRFEADRLYCVSHQNSSLVKLLSQRPQVGFEVAPNEPPYHGVRGQGMAELAPLSDDTLQSLLHHYLGGTDSNLGRWLLSRSEEEVLITVTPQRSYTRDYRQRMRDAA